MAESGIYEIVNLVNGQRYVGSAVNLTNRWRQHQCDLRKSRHNRRLQHAWHRHGTAAFEFRVLEVVSDKSQLLEREQHWLDKLVPEYNILIVAGSTLGYRHTPETKRKMSEASAGRKLSSEHVEAIRRANTGRARPDLAGNKYGCRQHSDQDRLINSASKIGRPKSSQARANIAAAAASPSMRARRSEFMKQVWAERKAARLQGDPHAK